MIFKNISYFLDTTLKM